jgi:hypothetical protein
MIVQSSPLGFGESKNSGNTHLHVGRLLKQSPLFGAGVKRGDRLKRIATWTMEEPPSFCREHEKSRQRLDLMQRLSIKAIPLRRKESLKEGSFVTKQSIQKTSMNPQSFCSGPTPPPMSTFDALRSPLVFGYERKVLAVPPGWLGICVKIINHRLTIVEVKDDSPIKKLIQNGDIIEGVNSPCDARWDILQFLAYMTETMMQTRIFYLQKKRKSMTTRFRFPLPVPDTSDPQSELNVYQRQKNSKHGASVVMKALPSEDPTGCDWNEIDGEWTTALV